MVCADVNSAAEMVREALVRIRHRGPDDDGIWKGDGIVLGHVRLSIIDLSATGTQPQCNEDGTVAVTFNGEIYNYKELRESLKSKGHTFRGSSDTEVIPHLYEEYGGAFATHLRGMFAIALWDSSNRRLVLARDRAGKKPMFYAHLDGGGFAFCSEMKGLFAVAGVDLSVREQGIYDFLSYGVVPGIETAYNGVHRVPPASTLTFSVDGSTTMDRYWHVEFVPKQKITYMEAVDETHRILTESIALRLRSDVPVGCFLSGGIDSGLIAAIASRQLDQPLRTYCIGFDDPTFDERPLAAQVAARYGTRHTEFVLRPATLTDELTTIISHYDEPYAAQSALPSWAVARLAATDIKVALTGDGGDEIFAGYRHFVAGRVIGLLGGSRTERLSGIFRALSGVLPVPRRGRTPYQMISRMIDVLGQSGSARYLALTNDRLREDEKEALFGERWNAGQFESSLRLIDALEQDAQGLGPLDSLMSKDFHQMLPDDHLVKMDIATMAHSFEVRSPFLDHELIEFVATLPEVFRLGGFETKPILRDLAKRLLPGGVAAGRKRGFEIPLRRWMRTDLNEMLIDTVLSQQSYAMTHFDQSAVRSLLVGDGWDQKRWANIVWALLCLEIWWTNYRRLTSA